MKRATDNCWRRSEIYLNTESQSIPVKPCNQSRISHTIKSNSTNSTFKPIVSLVRVGSSSNHQQFVKSHVVCGSRSNTIHKHCGMEDRTFFSFFSSTYRSLLGEQPEASRAASGKVLLLSFSSTPAPPKHQQYIQTKSAPCCPAPEHGEPQKQAPTNPAGFCVCVRVCV